MTVEELLDRLGPAKRVGENWHTRCPAHDDQHPSLSIREGDDGRVLLHCHAGCETDAILAALNIPAADLFPQEPRQVRRARTRKAVTRGSRSAKKATGYTVEQYAQDKQLPPEFLEETFGLSNVKKSGVYVVRIPYRDELGRETAIRYRHSLNSEKRFSWQKGATPTLYGLDRLSHIREQGYVLLVEGESDGHTGWHHGIPVLGIPGARTWQDGWAIHLEQLDPIYVVREPDQGGQALRDRLADSPVAARLRVVQLDGAKDLSDLHCQDPNTFKKRFQRALDNARRLDEINAGEADAKRDELWTACQDLAQSSRILDRLQNSLRAQGLAGEAHATSLVYLAVVSRWLPRPVSVIVKGPSSAGKSYIVGEVLRHVPSTAYYELTSASEKALIYGTEPIAHRMLVIYEAAGIATDFYNYQLRTLLSEGRLRYEVTERRGSGFETRLIEREGPTGLILTTTEVALHPENETRMTSVSVDDSPEQTQRILEALAVEQRTEPPSLDEWHALQTWLDSGEHRVVVPFAHELATLIAPVAVRLRRDFLALLNLIEAHGLLHQASRERDPDGRVIATLGDYAVVHELVADLFATTLQTAVPETIRDIVDVVQRLTGSGEPCSVSQVARIAKLDPSTVSRRVKAAIEAGYLVNQEAKPGRPYQLVIGDPLPTDRPVLPTVDTLARVMHDAVHDFEPIATGTNGDPCTVAAISEGNGDGSVETDEHEPSWVTDTDDEQVRI